MSDYEPSRYGRSYPGSTDTGGAGLFWLLVVVATLGVLVFVSAVGNTSAPQSDYVPQSSGDGAAVD